MSDPMPPYGRLVGRWVDSLGRPAQGSVTVAATQAPVTAATDQGRAIIVQESSVQMDHSGAVSIDVLAPAPGDPVSSAWSMTVTIHIPGVLHRTLTVSVRQGQTVDLTALSAASSDLPQDHLAAAVDALTARVAVLESRPDGGGAPTPAQPPYMPPVLHSDGRLTIGAVHE